MRIILVCCTVLGMALVIATFTRTNAVVALLISTAVWLFSRFVIKCQIPEEREPKKRGYRWCALGGLFVAYFVSAGPVEYWLNLRGGASGEGIPDSVKIAYIPSKFAGMYFPPLGAYLEWCADLAHDEMLRRPIRKFREPPTDPRD